MSNGNTTDPVLIEMREAARSFQATITVEHIVFGPSEYGIRIKSGRKNIGPLLFPREDQTIGQCLDEFLALQPEESSNG